MIAARVAGDTLDQAAAPYRAFPDRRSTHCQRLIANGTFAIIIGIVLITWAVRIRASRVPRCADGAADGPVTAPVTGRPAVGAA
jgi:hypothetical protein